MHGVPPTQSSAPTGAVFLSYASQDAVAAQRICDALRAAGIEVWFDQSELRGGDLWDHKIRDQIHDCRLFVPIISASTERRDEGYFRREWSLAVDRTRDMVHKKAFLVPVVIDGTSERGAAVPDKFQDFQWTRLPGGATPPAFVERIRLLLAPHVSPSTAGAAGPASGQVPATGARRSTLSRAATWGVGAIASVVCAYFVVDKFWLSKPARSPPVIALAGKQTPGAGAAAPFNPPPHSIAVLPFVNMSGDREQEYFSDGLTEELLDSLARINELQVAARTSAFAFKGKDTDISTIAHKLNVGAVLEGSVRRSGNTLRVTTQLINGVTGFHIWSRSYDRDLGDVLKLQSDIATAIASGLKVTLLSNVAAKIELGGTFNPAAFDAYLRGMKASDTADDEPGVRAAIAAFTEAIRQDPNYALAFARRSAAFTRAAGEFSTSVAAKKVEFGLARSDAEKAIHLAPDLAEGHLALARFFEQGSLEFAPAIAEYESAVTLAPGHANALRAYSRLARIRGKSGVAAGIGAARRSIVLDPLNIRSHVALGDVLFYARYYTDALAAYQDALALGANSAAIYAERGLSFYALGDLESARASCERKPVHWMTQLCLVVIYDRVGRHEEAKTMVQQLQADSGETMAYQYAEIFAQRGDTSKALDWLETALRLRDTGLADLRADFLVDPLRNEPRFRAIEQALKFPD